MRKILVIEDEQSLREAICDILEFEEYTVLQAENGKQGMEQALQHLPDIILCDIMMPVMNGKEVLAALRSNETTRLIPFIYITALSGRSDVRSGMELGADDYINKPITRNELLNAISARLKKSDAIMKTSKHVAELESINKSLNAFAHAVSHDLKVPLRAVNSYSKILLEDYAGILDKDGIRYLDTIRANSSKMNRLIDGLLSFSRQKEAEVIRTMVNMHNLAESVIADLTSDSIHKHAEITVADLPDAMCDETSSPTPLPACAPSMSPGISATT